MVKSMSSQSSTEFLEQRWITIHTDALAGNIRVLKGVLGRPGPKLMAVVKANAYGHGAVAVSPVLRDAGVDWFGVTTLAEGLELVAAGIDPLATPILLFSPLATLEQVRAAVESGLHLTVCDDAHLALVEAVASASIRPRLHLKVDTGMGRFGYSPALAMSVAGRWADWAGVYTHIARASDRETGDAERQIATFSSFVDQCVRSGLKMGVRHCANSAAALRLPNSRMDMVRIGTVVYGQTPSVFVPRPAGLVSDTFLAHAQVVFVRDLATGQSVGYGSEFVAHRLLRVAVLPIGFADGFGVAPESLFAGMRGLKHLLAGSRPAKQAFVTLHGRRAYVLGRVAMQTIVVDVTAFDPPVKLGDVADIPMRRLSASALLSRRYEP
jgi:alanine racemase